MVDRQGAGKKSKKPTKGFTDEERAAVRDTVRERAITWGKNRAEDERAVLAKIAQMPEPDRSMARRIHEIISATAPELSPRLWYGMPAYSKDGDVLCFFQPASKFGARYQTLGFNGSAHLDEGKMWSTAYALTGMTAQEETRVAALVKKAVG